MLRATIDINGRFIGELQIVRDRDCFDRVRNYTIRLRGEEEKKARVESFDSERGAWALVSEALSALGIKGDAA